MEMESSRRSLDRSKEPGILKKPRLAEPADRDPRGVLGVKGPAPDRERSFLPRGGPGGLPDPVAPRFRAGERERELDQSSSGYRGGSYQQQQQMQELAAQYKTALAELTFNSKPIITNLTIIAGENLHAAKVIGAIVCANILEVPSEQKLPSLYLLDSIVKNIGRDYIKYFATKLPEVFCKAYKQVDSSIHPGMRHLFGTWKGVFPPAPLLAIEKELGFPPTINGASSGGGGSRSDSQAQRPPRSIHVNPKYLEARQHLQQPSQNIPQPQRESPNESAHEKSQDLSYGERDFVSGYPRHSSSGISKLSGRFMDREIGTRPLGSGGKDTREAVVSQRTGFDVNPVKNYISGQTIVQPSSSKPRTTTKSSLKTSQNWKNSEEEEYMWDDVNSRLVDSGSANSSSWSVDGSEKSTSLHRAKRTVPEIEHLESKWNMLDSLSQSVKDAGKEDRAPPFRETEGHIPAARLPHDLASRSEREPSVDSLSTGGSVPEHQTPGLWSSLKMKVPFGGLDHLASRTSVHQGIFTASGSDELSTTADMSFPRTEVQYMGNSAAVAPPPLNPASMHGGVINNKHQPTLRSPSPSADTSAPSTFLPHQGSHTIADHDRLKPQRPTQLQGQSKQAVPSQVSPVSFSTCHQKDIQQSDILSNSQQLLTKTSLSSEVSSAAPLPFSQLQHQLPFLQHLEPDFQTQQSKRNSDSSAHMQEPSHPSLGFSYTQANASSGMSSSLHSTGHVLDQASASKLLAEIMKSGLISNTPVASLEDLIKPPLPSGPPPVQVLTTTPSSIPLSSAFPPISHSCIQTPAAHPSVPALPPLPPGPPPQSLVGASQPSSSVSTSMNPLSSLLSSLVAKGLISSGTKTSASTMKDMANQHLEQSSLPTCISMPLTTSDSPVHPTSMSNEPPKLESCSPECDISSKAIEETVKGLLGMEFKPEIIRKFHQSVIDCLYDDLENQCMKCGLRFKLKEDMERHFDWHAKFQMDNYDRASQKWYEDRNVVVAEHGGISCVSVCTSSETSDPEKREPMVPADEKQCICALCGEPFEDFYCEIGDEWMYRGTVYMSQAPRIGNTTKLEEVQGRLIVHANCASKCSSRDVEVATLV